MRRITWTLAIVASLLLGVGLLSLPSAASPASSTYVALGDSVAAGAGLGSSDKICDRSSRAYPYLVARDIGTSVDQLACSGAKLDEGIYAEQERGKTIIESQLARAFNSGSMPDLMTMTAGANDARWAQFIAQCYRFTCGTRADDARASLYLADVRLELNTTMAMIHRASNGVPPTLLVTGYYSPLPPDECQASGNLTMDELSWLDEKTIELNAAIQRTVSRYSFSEFVPIDFSAHSLCSSSPWVQGLDDRAPFHPTVNGQAAIARAVSEKYAQVEIGQKVTEPHSLREHILNWVSRYYN